MRQTRFDETSLCLGPFRRLLSASGNLPASSIYRRFRSVAFPPCLRESTVDAHCRSWGEVRVGRSCLFAMGAEVSSAYDVQVFLPRSYESLLAAQSWRDEDGGTRKRNDLFVFR